MKRWMDRIFGADSETLVRIHEKILFRTPDHEELMRFRWRPKAKERIEARLRDSVEYRLLVAPAVEEVKKAYRLFLFREANDDEISGHLCLLRRNTGRLDRAIESLRDSAALTFMEIRPLNVEMDLTGRCNQRCIMCYLSHPPDSFGGQPDLSAGDFRRMAGQIFPAAYRLSLSVAAEPLLHEAFPALVREAMRYRIPKVHMSTNGMLLTRPISGMLAQLGVHGLNVSLDASCRATYERLHRGGVFDTVLENIETLNRMKERHVTTRPELSLSFVLMKSNFREVPAFLRLADSLGAHAVHLQHMVAYEPLGMEGESLVHDKEASDEVLLQARSLAGELGIRLMDPGLFSQNPEPGRALDRFDLNLNDEDRERGCCPFPWHFVGITSDGRVFPCGWWYEGEEMGNLLDQSFQAVWHGPRFVELRHKQLDHRPGNDCKSCPASGMGPVTEASAFSERRLR